jgi:hypothetical protein
MTCADRGGVRDVASDGGVEARGDGSDGIDCSISVEASAGADGVPSAGMDVAGGVSTVTVAVTAAGSTAVGRPSETTGVAEVEPTVAAPGWAGIAGSAPAATSAMVDRASAARAERAELRVSVAPPMTRPVTGVAGAEVAPAAGAEGVATGIGTASAASATGTAGAVAVFASTAG